MSDADEVNKVLELMGSKARVSSGDLISTAMMEICKAVPVYISKLVEEEMKKNG